MSDLPDGWTKAPLRDLTQTTTGWNPRLATSETFRYVDIEAVDNAVQRIGVVRELPVAQAPSRARVQIKKGDVLFSLVRPYLRNVARVPEELDGQVASTAFVALRPQPGIASSFLFYQLVQEGFIKSIPTYGNSPPAARDEEFLDLEVPVAPAQEQERISGKVEELFSDLDAGIAALERARANLKRYRAAVLKAAVEGRLTETWRAAHRDPESAGKLLERILAERKRKWEESQLKRYVEKKHVPPKGWKDRYVEPATPKVESLSGLPNGWVWASLDQLLSVVTSGSRAWTKYYGRGSCVFVMAGNVRPMRLDFADRQFVDPPREDVERERTRIQRADVLATIVGANTGDVCSVEEDVQEHYVCQSVALLRPVESSLSRFISIFLNAEGGGKTQFRRVIYGQGRPHLGLDDIRNVVVALPPREEQVAIGEELERQLSICDGANAQIGSDAKRSSALRQAILKCAFEGKLVPQDPKDEPASELLARIRAGRMSEKGSPRSSSGEAVRKGRRRKGRKRV